MNPAVQPLQLCFALVKIQEHLRSGRTGDADAISQRVLESLPDQGTLLNRLGCEAYQAGRLSDAEDLLRLAVAFHPRESQIHLNLAFVLDAQGHSLEAAHLRESLTMPPFFTLPVRVMTDLGAWGFASNYDVRSIKQQPFQVETLPNGFPERARKLAKAMSKESRNDAWAVCAENMRMVYWRWEASGVSDVVMIPISRTNDIIYDPFWLKRYPFIKGWEQDDSRCVVDVTPFAPVRIKVEQECFFLGGHLTYGHWLADYLPKLHALQSAGLPESIPIIMTAMNDWQSEILDCMGLSERVVELSAASESRCTIIEFDRVWIADGFSMRTRYDFLRKIFTDISSSPSRIETLKGPRRIYIARSTSAKPDRVINAEEVRSYVQHRGFEVIYGENYSARQKADLFRQADIVITEPGSGEFTYYAFAPEKCILVQLMPSPLFESPSDVTLKAAFCYVVPFLDRVVYAIGRPLVSVDPAGLTTFPAVYSVKVIEAALDQAEALLSALPNS